jgi:PAS domain S-box-containing protein
MASGAASGPERPATDAESAERDRLLGELGRLQLAEQALRESEMRTMLALQGGNLSLWSMSCHERRMAVDHAWLALLGATLDPTMDEKEAWRSAIEQKDHAELLRLLDEHIAGRSEFLECTFRLRRDDGDMLWLMARGQIVERDSDGNPILVAGSMIDVTRWHSLEEQLRQAQKLESIGQLAAGIAHEINTPIQFIGDNTRFAAGSLAQIFALLDRLQPLLERASPEARAEAAAATEAADLAYLREELPKSLSQSEEGIERVATIVRAMKEFAHPSGGEPVPTDINHAIANTLAISRNEWKLVATLDTELAAGLPLVPLLPGDFNQVLLNLIVNAAHAIADAKAAGKPGLGRITVSTRLAGETVEVLVADDGCGIPEEIRERVYDPFFTTKEVGRGSGQGLAIARSVVVEKHRGTLGFTSQVGVGTTFVVGLPLRRG